VDIKKIEEFFGIGAVPNYSVEKEAPKYLKTGIPSLDRSLGGGIPKGSIVELCGETSTGKSTLALSIAKRHVNSIFINPDHDFDFMYAESICGDGMTVVQPSGAKDTLETIKIVVNSKYMDLIVLDSLDGLIPVEESFMSDVDGYAQVLAGAVRDIRSLMQDSETVLLFTNQLGYNGRRTVAVGASTVRYNTDIRMLLTKDTADKDGTFMGVEIIKNMFSPRPLSPIRLYNSYGEGVSVEKDILKCAIDSGIVTMRGSWVYHKENRLGHGCAEAETVLKGNKDVRLAILKELGV
jgi:recombination protein RecA